MQMNPVYKSEIVDRAEAGPKGATGALLINVHCCRSQPWRAVKAVGRGWQDSGA